MSDLLPYNNHFTVLANGMSNMGNSCYFNSILQCLLSCTSIFEVLKKNINNTNIKNNTLAKYLIILHNISCNNDNNDKICFLIWREIIQISQKRKDKIQMSLGGQQDAHEGLLMFLDAIDTIPCIKRLFEHRHLHRIFCNKCNQWVMNKYETNLIFEIQPDLKTEQDEMYKNIDDNFNKSIELNKFLMNQNGFIDDDYICPNSDCKKKGKKYKTTTLAMIPEILPIVIKKYKEKILTLFPIKLEFTSEKLKKKFIYKLCAQSEHSGNMLGGHYWAICLRKENDNLIWKMLNDNSVSDCNPGPTIHTYILFYCYTHDEDI